MSAFIIHLLFRVNAVIPGLSLLERSSSLFTPIFINAVRNKTSTVLRNAPSHAESFEQLG